MKAEGAMTNTHIQTVQGMAVIKDRCYQMPLTVRFTSDQYGESLSLEAEYAELMLAVSFEEVWEMIQEARSMR